MTRIIPLAAAALFALVGCGPGTRPDPVEVKGKVTFSDGKPVSDVLLTLQPMDTGSMGNIPLGADGSFSEKVVPGKYWYYFSSQEGKNAAEKKKFWAAYQAIPEKYRSAGKNHKVTVSSGSNLDIKLD